MKAMLNREGTPFDESFWNLIDTSIVEIAQKKLSARKILETETVNCECLCIPQNYKREKIEEDIETVIPHGNHPIHFYTSFLLSSLQIDYFTKTGVETGLETLVSAVNRMAAQEDKIVFHGIPNAGVHGIFSIPGTHTITFPLWDSSGAATDTILSGIELLDKSGFHGPYSLALSSELYTKLFRKYPQSSIPEILNVKALLNDNVVKCAGLESEGVLIASGTENASIVLFQDLSAGFEGPSGIDFTFTLSENVSLKVNAPEAICLLNLKK